jgi:hypothetical protein
MRAMSLATFKTRYQYVKKTFIQNYMIFSYQWRGIWAALDSGKPEFLIFMFNITNFVYFTYSLINQRPHLNCADPQLTHERSLLVKSQGRCDVLPNDHIRPIDGASQPRGEASFFHTCLTKPDLTNDFIIAMKPYLVCSVILCFQIVKASIQTFIHDFIIIQSWIKIHSPKITATYFL